MKFINEDGPNEARAVAAAGRWGQLCGGAYRFQQNTNKREDRAVFYVEKLIRHWNTRVRPVAHPKIMIVYRSTVSMMLAAVR